MPHNILALPFPILKEKHYLGDLGQCITTYGSTGGYKQSDGDMPSGMAGEKGSWWDIKP